MINPDFSFLIDFSEQYKECKKLESVPEETILLVD